MIIQVMAATFAMATPGQSHNDCLQSVARSLEVSGDSAEAVASATVTACVPAEGWSDIKPGSIAASMSPAQLRETIQLDRELSRDKVLLWVVRYRACRKTPTCNVATLPQ